MKKYLLSLAVLLIGVSLFTSCENDDDDVNPRDLKKVTHAAYVVNAGLQSAGSTGTLTRVDMETWTTAQNVFSQVNGRNLGVTVNDAVVYGSKMYIVVDGEGSVEVVDKNTLHAIKRIELRKLIRDDKGKSPRRAVAANGCVYVTTFGGVVAAIDTVSLGLKKTYQAGSCPDGIAYHNGKLYVCNSDFGRGKGNLSVIDVASGDTTMIFNEHLTNPVAAKFIGSDLYVLHDGSYDRNWFQTGAGVMKVVGKQVTKVSDATLMAVNDKRGSEKIYTINAPYTNAAIPATYNVYDVRTGKTATFTTTKVEAPSAMAVDPVTGYVYIMSYRLNPETHRADYEGAGYVNVYNASGKLLHTLAIGVGATGMVFDYK